MRVLLPKSSGMPLLKSVESVAADVLFAVGVLALLKFLRHDLVKTALSIIGRYVFRQTAVMSKGEFIALSEAIFITVKFMGSLFSSM